MVAAETGFEMIRSHRLFGEARLGFHPKDQHPQVSVQKNRCSDWQFAPVHNIVAAQSETEE